VTRRIATALALVASVLVVAACGTLNRTATLNQNISGAAAAHTLKQQLARLGHPGARVRCAKRLIANVGITRSCSISGAGTYTSVRFTFSSPRGTINTGSVKVS
jgi:hypothetical protein